MQNTLTRFRRENGFTLIELLIVIVVLGILAGIILFAIGGTKTDAEANSKKTSDKICATARSAAAVSDKPYTDYVSDASKC